MNVKPATTSQTILIAEDEAFVMKMMMYCLQKAGYTLLAATDGKEALDCLRTTSPDLVITDLMMPYHNGLEVLNYVKTTVNSSIPVIILSASGQESIIQQAFELGASEYITKPFMPNDLINVVKKYLSNGL
ncbi:response regulator [Spirosoma utsteinense]|uniref:CheY-like chemotaxis protein n=1 Tax=Spirosoma utsteinense TaxID=2585773 RepID=A0ABR6W578_9BACT|nr:response regulator [Spirosoma utsteinense]MBC3788008.1 CheY-like chemotaxis protein [Spirosoma utsteinense]MBC3791293.1 CheY-like chemotaxis protein [Spirosoma utsteinense]